MTPYGVIAKQWVNLLDIGILMRYSCSILHKSYTLFCRCLRRLRLAIYLIHVAYPSVYCTDMWQSYNSMVNIEVIIMDLGKISRILTTTKHNKTQTMCIIPGVYSIYVDVCISKVFLMQYLLWEIDFILFHEGYFLHCDWWVGFGNVTRSTKERFLLHTVNYSLIPM